MNKVIFVGFDTEQQAYEGDRALHGMHREGTLTLYNDAIVVKEPTDTSRCGERRMEDRSGRSGEWSPAASSASWVDPSVLRSASAPAR